MPTLLEKLRQQGFNDGVKATAKHLKLPYKATLKTLTQTMKPVEEQVKPEAPLQKPMSNWLSHVNEYRTKNGGTMKEAMRSAKGTYKK